MPSDANAVQRGEQLTTIFLCKRCHTENLSGQVYFEALGLVSIPTPNLTSGEGGVGSFYTDQDWVRAIRHGVGNDGRALFLMLSNAYQYLGEEDLSALIAYLKSIPPVDNKLPERRIEPLGNLMMGAGLFPPFPADQIDHARPVPVQPQPGATAAYGEYLSHICTGCHGTNFNGAPLGPLARKFLRQI